MAALAATTTRKVTITRLCAIMMLSRLEGEGMMEVFARTAINGMVAFACVVAVKNMIILLTPLALLGWTYALARPLTNMMATLLVATATAVTCVCTAECGWRASVTYTFVMVRTAAYSLSHAS